MPFSIRGTKIQLEDLNPKGKQNEVGLEVVRKERLFELVKNLNDAKDISPDVNHPERNSDQQLFVYLGAPDTHSSVGVSVHSPEEVRTVIAYLSAKNLADGLQLILRNFNHSHAIQLRFFTNIDTLQFSEAQDFFYELFRVANDLNINIDVRSIEVSGLEKILGRELDKKIDLIISKINEKLDNNLQLDKVATFKKALLNLFNNLENRYEVLNLMANIHQVNLIDNLVNDVVELIGSRQNAMTYNLFFCFVKGAEVSLPSEDHEKILIKWLDKSKNDLNAMLPESLHLRLKIIDSKILETTPEFQLDTLRHG